MSRRVSGGDSACPISFDSSVTTMPSAAASDSAGSLVEKFPVHTTGN